MDVSALMPGSLAGGSGTLERLPRVTDGRAVQDVARNFEGVFLSTLLKEMRGTLEPDTMFGENQGDVLGGMFDMYLGQHLAGAGSLGIGALVQKYLKGKLHDQATKALPPGHAA